MKYAIGSLRFSLNEGGVAYYQQLIEQITQGIASGELSVGDRLPSSRALAVSLGVSRSTTSRAYDQLVAEGVLVSEEKRGVFVSTLPVVGRRGISISDGKKTRNQIQSRQKIEKMGFDSGVDVSAFPAKEWSTSMRRSWLNPDMALLQGGYQTGYPALKDAIVDYLYRVRGLECMAEQIIITAGNRDSLILLQHALSRLLESKQRTSKKTPISWWLESPTYPPMREILSQKGEILTIHVDDEGPSLPNDRPINVGVITPNRQYPLGTSISSQRRQQWLQKLVDASSNWWLVEDDYDNEFVYQGRSDVPFMQTASLHERARDRVCFVGSFSKVLFRGLRLGFIVAPEKQVDLIKQSQVTLGSSSSLPVQPAVADFMIQGSFDRHINRMRRHYRIKRDFLLALLTEKLSPWFEWKKPRGGMHVLIEFKADVLGVFPDECLDRRIATELSLKNVHLSTLSSHYVDQAIARQGFVLGFSGPTESVMSQVVCTLQVYLQKCMKNESSRNVNIESIIMQSG
ncbi:GntR family transcriptional regulator [Marinomonas ushuaiensis DSM 15871]|uniref:GntR family transcriptional regulator n=1 Tax=Marinomonas ushuaiensis DSM 15871 TaxID=1122207 RepID=X7EAR0_9GAMM|nr:PLP-dependent aminotransferase family protein [Marinomonas ushuaiensis]ETX12213.1 GntR family transcriptional regulator [Marinomonas ushuaiensis DSM 15871]